MIVYYDPATGAVTGYENFRVGEIPADLAYIDLSYSPLPTGDDPFDYYVDLATLTMVKKDQAVIDAAAVKDVADEKIKTIKSDFDTAEPLPVAVAIAAGEFEFSGGYDSSQKLDGKRRLVQESFALGMVTTDDVEFLTDDDTQITMSMADATKVVLAVAQRYEDDLYRKKGLIALARSIQADTAKTTQEKIDAISAITWSTPF